MAGDIGCIIRSQKCEQGCDLLRFGVAAQGNLAIQFLEHFIGVFGALHWRHHIPWSNGTDSHSRREFQCHAFG